MKTTKTILGFTALFAASAAFGFLIAPAAQEQVAEGLPAANGIQTTASWTSTAESVAEQVLESDTVVRVQVLERSEPYFVSALDGKDDSLGHLAEDVAKRGLEAPVLPFTRTTVEVLEAYAGEVEIGDRIELLQTGGELPDGISQIVDDPLYEVGTEQVLFLANISSDALHGGRVPLFRTLNPASRYAVQGGQLESLYSAGKAVLPADLDTLEGEIRTALESLEDGTLSAAPAVDGLDH